MDTRLNTARPQVFHKALTINPLWQDNREEMSIAFPCTVIWNYDRRALVRN